MTEEDEDDDDGIRFVTLESRFENKETVLNWLTIDHFHKWWPNINYFAGTKISLSNLIF